MFEDISLDSERWSYIPNTNNKYLASTKGRIISLRRSKPLVLRQAKNKRYNTVGVIKNGKMTTSTVHRLVISSFIKNVNNHPCINHINEDKRDNSFDNLEWCTEKENFWHSLYRNHNMLKQMGAKGEDNVTSKLRTEDVIEIRKLYAQGDTQRSISKKYNVSFQSIHLIVKNKSWKHI